MTQDSPDIKAYLSFMVEHGASDLFLTVGAPPSVKVQGEIHPIHLPPLSSEASRTLMASILTSEQIATFRQELELDLAQTLEPLGRFRFNFYMQRGEVAAVIRHIRSDIPSFQQLNLPKVLADLILQKRGLILVVGAAGSGKSTTLAAMLEHRNLNSSGHILTIEDPIEYVHQHRKSLVDQREVGLDTHSFADALRHAMREAPDVIMIGEIRDQLTMQHALAYAETGHLCVSTLHANNANQAIDRIINFFPEERRRQVLLDLSLNLKSVIAQRLIQGAGNFQVPATEVMLQSNFISDLILKGEIDQIKDAIAKSTEVGMHTFDQSLFQLYQHGAITELQAIDNADSKTDIALKIRLSPGHIHQDSHLELRRETGD